MLFSEIPHLGALQLQLQLVRNEGDELRIGGLSFCIGHGIAEEPLEGTPFTCSAKIIDRHPHHTCIQSPDTARQFWEKDRRF